MATSGLGTGTGFFAGIGGVPAPNHSRSIRVDHTDFFKRLLKLIPKSVGGPSGEGTLPPDDLKRRHPDSSGGGFGHPGFGVGTGNNSFTRSFYLIRVLLV